MAVPHCPSGMGPDPSQCGGRSVSQRSKLPIPECVRPHAQMEDEDPQLPVSYDIPKLQAVFGDTYGFETELWDIPDHESHMGVNQKVMNFSRLGGNSKEYWKILFYAGHGKSQEIERYHGRGSSSNVPYSLLLLENLQCNVGIASTDEGQGTTELISACAYNAKANGVGHYSFTNALVLELKALALMPSFPISVLYSRIYHRVQHRMQDDEAGTERHPAPVHLTLCFNKKFPRAIQLSPRKYSNRFDKHPTRQPEGYHSSDHQSPSSGTLHHDHKIPRLVLKSGYRTILALVSCRPTSLPNG